MYACFVNRREIKVLLCVDSVDATVRVKQSDEWWNAVQQICKAAQREDHAGASRTTLQTRY